MNLPIVFHKNYVAPMPEGHRFPMQKFRILYELLLAEKIIQLDQVFTPNVIEPEILNSVHDPNYVGQYKNGLLDKNSQRKIGIPWSKEIVTRTLTALGGSLLTSELALKYGIACNTAGGTHHAFLNYGSGFCIFNDIALVALTLLRRKAAKKILIIDLDVHQGDGTANMLSEENDIFTFSMHCKSNFPFKKQESNLDVELVDGIKDEEYLRTLNSFLPDLFSSVSPDFIIYDAGVDPHENDPLGKLALTYEGLYKRDLTVLNKCAKNAIPVSCIIGGGYSKDLNELAYRHSILHRAADKIYRKYKL